MICHTSVVDSCIGILTQVSGANQLLTKLLVKSLQLLVLHYTQAWEQLLTGTADCHKVRMTSVWSSTEDRNGSKEVVSERKGRETDRGSCRESKLL